MGLAGEEGNLPAKGGLGKTTKGRDQIAKVDLKQWQKGKSGRIKPVLLSGLEKPVTVKRHSFSNSIGASGQTSAAYKGRIDDCKPNMSKLKKDLAITGASIEDSIRNYSRLNMFMMRFVAGLAGGSSTAKRNRSIIPAVCLWAVRRGSSPPRSGAMMANTSRMRKRAMVQPFRLYRRCSRRNPADGGCQRRSKNASLWFRRLVDGCVHQLDQR